MRPLVTSMALGLALAICGCASQEKEWMKINQTYTQEEFRRDYASCSRGVTVDETCMRSKGWVAVSPGKVEKPEEVQRPGPPTGIGPNAR